MPTLLPYHFHRWNVGISVSNKDHALERDRPLIHRYPFVDGLVVPIVDYALIDSEKKLRLRRVVNSNARPYSQTAFVEVELRTEYVRELVCDLATFNDLLVPRRNDKVLQL